MAARSVLKMLGGMVLLASAGAASSASQIIPDAYRRIAAQEKVPAESLYSLAMAESTRKTDWGAKPWPWTINVAGKGYHYETREEAWEALLGFMQRYPLRRIDVGVAQVNLGWNGQHFPTFRDAFDPYTNLRAAARILRACYDARPGSWIRAAGCYHHPAGGQAANTYMAIVRSKLSQISPETTLTATAQPVAMTLTWIEPK
ncbi:transglycosylase SLT domain-containing protein [Salmonella enterica subsp. enterica serovar Typhimurium]|nr:transglycosylase SLT domain-containing protein [Salmonella enterica subsp. enterica serovar Typhimurium]EIF3372506.1 transglycosylase SLT domain-containing protein [Salmonella enterica subsp. enterica serovar Typhimurium]EII7205913.1 transglycosylase SLT domain-containing protein [Salmonella enterica subsp. enterica serovar Typhimurium]EIP0078520.1 transglycosylase SLT domain-containing protein [Salmonella enterica subsp. enterica serovar Typhimurium]EIW9444971.1 transglycosylase SLT domain-